MSLMNTQNVELQPTENPFSSLSPNISYEINPAIVSFRYFGISVAIFAIFMGTIGNLFTILAYFANTKLQTTFNLLVVNLSVVDLVTASLMLPFNLAGYIQMRWPFGNDSFTARLQFFSYFCCGYTSVVFLVTITINRFIGVFCPTKYDALFKKRRIRCILLFCWTFAPILLLPFLVGTDPSCPNVNQALTGFHPMQLLCTFICLPTIGWNPYMQITRILFQFLPLGVMIVCYVAIFLHLRKKAKALTLSMTKSLRSASDAGAAVVTAAGKSMLIRQVSSQSNLGKNVISSKRKCSMAETRRAQSNKRMLIISVVICVAFMITFLPSVIINILPGRKEFDTRFHMAASNVSWFNSALNPIIYVILNPQFRREYLRLVKLLFGKTKEKFVHDSTATTIKKKGMNNPKKNSVSVSNPNNQQIKTVMTPVASTQDVLNSEM